MKNIIVLFSLLTITSCTNDSSTSTKTSTDTAASISLPPKPLVISTAEDEGWGGDLKLSITEIKENDTANIYKVVSTYEGNNLGLQVSIPKIKEKNKGFASGLTLSSIGKESDNLLATLALVYKQKMDSSIQFTNSISLNYVNLSEFGKSLGAQESKSNNSVAEYKLFFQGDEDYAELYLNVNPEEHWIELNEKDEEYRPAIIKFLRK